MQLDYLFVIKSGLARDETHPDYMVKDELASVDGSTAANDPNTIRTNINTWLANVQAAYMTDPTTIITLPYCEIDWVNGPPTGMARGVVGTLRVTADKWDTVNQAADIFFEKVRAHVAEMNGIDADKAKAYQIQENDLPDKRTRTQALWGVQPLSMVVECFEPEYGGEIHPNSPNRYSVTGFIGGVGGKH